MAFVALVMSEASDEDDDVWQQSAKYKDEVLGKQVELDDSGSGYFEPGMIRGVKVTRALSALATCARQPAALRVRTPRHPLPLPTR